MTQAEKKLAVAGVGNLLMQDEGVGIHVIRRLEREGMPEDVILIDAGVAILDAAWQVEKCEHVLIIDATDGGEEPGAVYRYKLEDIGADGFRNGYLAGTHQIGLAEALRMNRLSGTVPADITVIGIQPGNVDYGTELSVELEAKMDTIMSVVREEIERLSGNTDAAE